MATSYRAVLRTGPSTAQACPALGAGLEHNLLGLERRLAIDPFTCRGNPETEKQVDPAQRMGKRTAVHLKARADEV